MVRQWSLGRYASRPEWYDRNPTAIVKKYTGGSIAPHGSTQRWSYTVPTGKISMLEHMRISCDRYTAPTTPGRVRGQIQINSGGETNVVLLMSWFNSATVDTEAKDTLALALVLVAGNTIMSYTDDASTGGTCNYNIVAKLTEFDA